VDAAPLPPFASFGAGSHLAEPFSLENPERIDIGDGVYIGPGAFFSVVAHHNGRDFSPRLWIGDGASLGPGLVISCIREVSIGPRVLAGPRVFIGDSYHDYRDPDMAVLDQPMSDPRPVIIGAGAFLGVHSAILPGVTVGQRAYVAANAVVTHDVPPRAVVAGNPARIIRRWDAEAGEWRRESPDRDDAVRREPSDAEAALRERMSHLEQRLGLADVRRMQLAEELAAASTQGARDTEATHASIERLRVELDEERRLREAAERWLAALQRSPSWRVTAPLRALKRSTTGRLRRP
jgi:acetyltransferase-like isoleucine patch superfamily enzyme